MVRYALDECRRGRDEADTMPALDARVETVQLAGLPGAGLALAGCPARMKRWPCPGWVKRWSACLALDAVRTADDARMD